MESSLRICGSSSMMRMFALFMLQDIDGGGFSRQNDGELSPARRKVTQAYSSLVCFHKSFYDGKPESRAPGFCITQPVKFSEYLPDLIFGKARSVIRNNDHQAERFVIVALGRIVLIEMTGYGSGVACAYLDHRSRGCVLDGIVEQVV